MIVRTVAVTCPEHPCCVAKVELVDDHHVTEDPPLWAADWGRVYALGVHAITHHEAQPSVHPLADWPHKKKRWWKRGKPRRR